MPPDSVPYPPPVAGPPSWLPLIDGADSGAEPGAPSVNELGLPGQHWPKLETVDYISKLIILIVLLLALPWLIGKLLTAPHELTGHSAGLAMNIPGA